MAISSRKGELEKWCPSIDPSSVAFDVDGVCADTMGLFLQILEHDFGIQGIRQEDITCYSLEKCLDVDENIVLEAIRRILDGDYPFELKPIDGAVEVLTRIADVSGKLLFVTARPKTGPVEDWIRDLIPSGTGRIEVVATGAYEAKAGVLLEKKVSHFVEDRLDSCFTLSDAGITPLLLAQPWNRERHPFVEVKTWDELGKLIAI